MVNPAFLSERDAAATSTLAADDQRFSQIVANNLDFIWRWLRRIGVPAPDVDDAVQQVFLVTASKLSAIAVGSERAFLLGTASRIAANAGRLMKRRDRAIHCLVHAERTDVPSQEELIDRLRARLMMDRILGEMPNKLREVLVLFELEELRVTEVAEILSMPIGTVGSRLRRAREDFRTRSRRLKAMGREGQTR